MGARERMLNPDGSLNVGVSRNVAVNDFYHWLVTRPWSVVIGMLTTAFFGANAVFAAAYLLAGDAIENARPGSFADAYFFSIQTMATIGYGKMVPATFLANVLVGVESFVGMLGLALATGLMFAKFSRPTARVLFSGVAVVTTRDGVPSLMFRIANERDSHIVEAQAHVILVRSETTREGESVRRFYDLELSRRQNALFALSWTVVHPIEPSSPLWELSRESLEAMDAEILVSVVGLDAQLSQTIHARHSYLPNEIVWNARFADMLTRASNGRWRIDASKLSDVIHLEASH